MGCNSFETAYPYYGSRLMQKCNKDVPILNSSHFYPH